MKMNIKLSSMILVFLLLGGFVFAMEDHQKLDSEIAEIEKQYKIHEQQSAIEKTRAKKEKLLVFKGRISICNLISKIEVEQDPEEKKFLQAQVQKIMQLSLNMKKQREEIQALMQVLMKIHGSRLLERKDHLLSKKTRKIQELSN